MALNGEESWLERMRYFLFVEAPEETGDPLEAAAEVVEFIMSGGAWSDFPFSDGDPPDMRRTVDALDLSQSYADSRGWSSGNIRDLVQFKEKNTRCLRCRVHVDKWWGNNEAFEREVARLVLEMVAGDAEVAKYCVAPDLADFGCDLDYLEVGAASRVKRLIDELAR